MSGTGKPGFSSSLTAHRLELLKGKITTLQINVGLLCNQACRHCHLDAGPDRVSEMMSAETFDQIAAFAASNRFQTVDITGGAPELHPQIGAMIRGLRPLCSTLIIRSNLTALARKSDSLLSVFSENQVAVTASFPSLNELQTDSVRGKGVFQKSIKILQVLNAAGYGQADSGLELNLVVNPSGAFLPPSQEGIERRYRKILGNKWGIVFNKLFSFANVPLGRFRNWLIESGNLEKYEHKLSNSFNPCTVEGLMCRNILSVSWDGFLYDCDFNQAAGLYLGGSPMHISEIVCPPDPGFAVTLGNHCYTCTAGAGFT